jgi:hypothetical protein
VKIQTSAPPFGDVAKQIQRDFARATTAGMREAGAGLKTDLREAIRAAFPDSRRMPNLIGVDVYPKGEPSLGAAISVWQRAKKRWEPIFDALTAGAVIKARGGKYLAIPTENVPGRGPRGRPLTVTQTQDAIRQDLELVPTKKPGVLLLVAERQSTKSGRFRKASRRSRTTGRGLTTIVYFILVRQTRQPRRTNPVESVKFWQGRIPALIDAAVAAIPRTR